jgi:hypothetical protein
LTGILSGIFFPFFLAKGHIDRNFRRFRFSLQVPKVILTGFAAGYFFIFFITKGHIDRNSGRFGCMQFTSPKGHIDRIFFPLLYSIARVNGGSKRYVPTGG